MYQPKKEWQIHDLRENVGGVVRSMERNSDVARFIVERLDLEIFLEFFHDWGYLHC